MVDYEELGSLYAEQEEDMYYEDRDYFIETINEEILFPADLEAANSNWRGQTGYLTVDSAEELVSKCFSFGNDHLHFRKNDQGYYIRTASHDVPMGFNIYIESAKDELDV